MKTTTTTKQKTDLTEMIITAIYVLGGISLFSFTIFAALS
jgi:hypothetical protein